MSSWKSCIFSMIVVKLSVSFSSKFHAFRMAFRKFVGPVPTVQVELHREATQADSFMLPWKDGCPTTLPLTPLSV